MIDSTRDDFRLVFDFNNHRFNRSCLSCLLVRLSTERVEACWWAFRLTSCFSRDSRSFHATSLSGHN
jgi:hypothetical protein